MVRTMPAPVPALAPLLRDERTRHGVTVSTKLIGPTDAGRQRTRKNTSQSLLVAPMHRTVASGSDPIQICGTFTNKALRRAAGPNPIPLGFGKIASLSEPNGVTVIGAPNQSGGVAAGDADAIATIGFASTELGGGGPPENSSSHNKTTLKTVGCEGEIINGNHDFGGTFCLSD